MNKQIVIFGEIALNIVQSIPGTWRKAVLNIEVLNNFSSYYGNFYDENEEKKSIPVSKFEPTLDQKLILLHQITTTEPPVHKNWNRAIFTLYPNNKSEIEYIWDQDLLDQVDGYCNETEPLI